MISIDTNLLLPALETSNTHHAAASGFLGSLQDRADVIISEFVLLELYVLVRNPAVIARPLTASQASTTCGFFRNHPRWQLVGFPTDSRPFHDELWRALKEGSLARRRAYDLRLAYSLLRQGVTDFATVNTKDFRGLGFRQVWNPLDG